LFTHLFIDHHVQIHVSNELWFWSSYIMINHLPVV